MIYSRYVEIKEKLNIDYDIEQDLTDLYSELNKNIDYLKEHNCNIETIRNFLITNPQLISMSPEEFKNIVIFVVILLYL